MSQTLFMETTEISPDRTVGEIQKILARRGASAVLMEYDGKGGVAAVSFRFKVGPNDLPFRLPCRWESIFTILRRRAGVSDSSLKWMNIKRRESLEEKSKRVAWRQILRWIEAQLALVETNMVKVEEVFLPYMQTGKGGETVFELTEKRGFMALEFKGAES